MKCACVGDVLVREREGSMEGSGSESERGFCERFVGPWRTTVGRGRQGGVQCLGVIYPLLGAQVCQHHNPTITDRDQFL